MKKIIKFIFVVLLCFGLNVNSNKKDYSKVATYDMATIISQSMYFGLAELNINKVYQNGYYAPYYFKNLVDNFPVNSHDTCNYTAIAMLLSFYDTYWNDSIIADRYEMKADLNSNSHPHNVYSPGVTYENEGISNLSSSEYNSYIMSSYNTDFQALLIKIARDYGIVTNSDFGMNLYQIRNLLNCYLSITNNYSYSFTTLTNQDENLTTYSFVKKYIKQGFPVLLRVASGASTNGHTLIAYDYDESTGELYVHTGWKRGGVALSHIPLGTTIYSQLLDAIVLLPVSTHYHTDNYYSGGSYFCPCQIMYRNNNINIENTTNYLDRIPKYSWDSTCKEIWISSNNFKYIVTIKDSLNNVISTYETKKNEITLRPADWKYICETKTNYKLDVRFVYTGEESFYNINNSNLIKTFTVPSSLKDNPYLTPSMTNVNAPGYLNVTTYEYNINNNSFSIGYKRSIYNANDDVITVSTIGTGINTTSLYFEFENPITRLDMELAICEDSQNELIKGKYRIRMFKLDDNNNEIYLSSLVENDDSCDIKELPIGINNMKLINTYFNEPIEKFVIKFEYLGFSLLSLGNFAIGDMIFYKGDLPGPNNPLPLSGYELEYEPEKWNNNDLIPKETNGKIDYYYFYELFNCYAYTLDTQFFGRIDPGFSTSFPINENEVCDIGILLSKIQADSTNYGFTFIPISKYETCPIGTYKVALVLDDINEINVDINKDVGYHWYRQNSDGTWSHKPGTQKIVNYDFMVKTIYDPEICDRRNSYTSKLIYNQFIGFYAVSPLRLNEEVYNEGDN